MECEGQYVYDFTWNTSKGPEIKCKVLTARGILSDFIDSIGHETYAEE
jgi:hypothetical protein